MKIKKLDQSVVNKIAAGEIIIQPANALKELLENCIDAGSTTIEVLVKDGGLKLLQVTDNGFGIDKEDLELLCQRFATSKLSKYEDLYSIATYGFRGEALASISHIAHLSVVTKTKDSPLAYKAFYNSGQLTDHTFKLGTNGTPKPIAGKNGTQITIEDIFYNSPNRKRALKSKNDEFIKILDIVGRYAVHSDVGISCKKFGEPHQCLSTRPKMSLKERIRTVFGSSIANELLEFEEANLNESGLLKITAALTSANYNNKKKIQPIFFINNRLVQCEPLKRAIVSVYNYFLPKGNSAFIYIDLQIDPQNVDVNIHPTKKEVRFLNEDEIIGYISGKVHSILQNVDTSRTYKTQSILTKENNNEATTALKSTTKVAAAEVTNTNVPIKKHRQENKLVRTDAKQSKLQFQNGNTKFQYDIDTSAQFRNLNLTSVNKMKQSIIENWDKELTSIFNDSTYIGIVDEEKRLCSFQHGVRLFICDYGSLLNELYYQLALENFANFGKIEFQEPIGMSDLLSNIYKDNSNSNLMVKDQVISKIISMKEMLEDYFKIAISEDNLYIQYIPMIHKDISPSLSKLGHFVYRLGAMVDFEDEESCIKEILQQIALLYVPERLEINPINDAKRQQLDTFLENTIFPLMQKKFIASKTLMKDVVQIADLPGLYKVFERC